MRTYFRVSHSVVTFMSCVLSPLQRSLIANISCIHICLTGAYKVISVATVNDLTWECPSNG